jgi:hypothetical protein
MTAVSDEWAAEARDHLPAMVRRFVERNLPGALPNVTRVLQRGRMWRAPVPRRWGSPLSLNTASAVWRSRGERSSRSRPDRLVVDRRCIRGEVWSYGRPHLGHHLFHADAWGRGGGRRTVSLHVGDAMDASQHHRQPDLEWREAGELSHLPVEPLL